MNAGKNVVITGASKGIGRSIAEKFYSSGYNLLVCSRNESDLSGLAKQLKPGPTGNSINFYAADLSDKTQAQQFGNWVLQQNGSIDILVNNAGTFIPGSIYNEEDGVLEQMLAINLSSAYHITRTLLPKMMQDRSGHIFNMCSIASLKAYHNGGSYSISKFGLMGFSRNLREEMKPFNIKVTSVYPGAVYTSSWEESGIEKTRIMETGDIAEMIFAASQLSPQACVEDIVIRPQKGDVD